MAKKTKVQYIGELQVKSIEWNLVMFEDGTSKEYTDKQLTYMVCDTKKDLSEARDLMIDNLVPEIITLLEQHNIRKGDLSAIINTVIDSYNEAFNVAIWKAFWTYRAGVNSQYFTEDIEISNIKKLMSS